MSGVIRIFFSRSFDDSYGDAKIQENVSAQTGSGGDEYIEFPLPTKPEKIESAFRRLVKRGFWESDQRMFYVNFFVCVQISRTSDSKPIYESDFYCDSSEDKIREYLDYLLDTTNKLSLVLSGVHEQHITYIVNPVILLTGDRDGDDEEVGKWLQTENHDIALTKRLHDYYDTSAWCDEDNINVWTRRYVWRNNKLEINVV